MDFPFSSKLTCTANALWKNKIIYILWNLERSVANSIIFSKLKLLDFWGRGFNALEKTNSRRINPPRIIIIIATCGSWEPGRGSGGLVRRYDDVWNATCWNKNKLISLCNIVVGYRCLNSERSGRVQTNIYPSICWNCARVLSIYIYEIS